MMRICQFAIVWLGISLVQSCLAPTCSRHTSKEQTDPSTNAFTHPTVSKAENEPSLSEKEIILDGWLTLHIPGAIITQKLGSPPHTGKKEESGNTGVLTQIWEYPQYGLYLLMDLNNADHIVQVYGIEAVYPCPYKTSRHIGIGSSVSNLKQAYPTGRYSNDYFSTGDPYGICMNFKIAADTVTSISIFQDFD